jgi:hypothetical protein
MSNQMATQQSLPELEATAWSFFVAVKASGQ